VAAGKSWSRECLLLALNLYHKLPFGQFHQNIAEIVEIARRMGRTPGSMAMKLCNLASLDPTEPPFPPTARGERVPQAR
jgi:putative restriction endonuclease